MSINQSSLDGFADELERRFASQIRSHRVMPAEDGTYAPFPETLRPELANVLRQGGINQLYSHQATAFDHVAADRHTVLVSRTASGKTLSFLLPILNSYLSDDSRFGVLLLYPTKALSRDQEGTLGKLLDAAGAELRLGTFDGDTPREERQRIQQHADFMITNPDMLHAGILPNHHRRWRDFLSRLRYVVIDEVHTYRGAFGSHVANVIRRLRRICRIHGSDPTFICSSATIGNPKEHVEALFGVPFEVVDGDGSPRPQRDLYLLNPPLQQSHGFTQYRKGPGSVTVPLIRAAAERGIRTICFCRARQQVERLYRAVCDKHPELRDRVKPYRGGLLPNERRKLERDLANGNLTTIISTNALELGIDIGDLDLCLLSGHPGSFSSFWQQAGRVGRRGDRAIIVFTARDAPIDQYLINHPDYLERANAERAWLSADNPYVLLQHLPCAAHEHPLRDQEPIFGDRTFDMALGVLKDNETVKQWRDTWRYALRDYPAKGVNLRGMTDYNVDIYHGNEIIGEIDPIGARGELYKDAIYQHLGRRYMSLELDLEKKLCRVEPVAVDYYTEAVWDNRIQLDEVEEERAVQAARLRFGPVTVNIQPKLYKKIRERTFENVGYGPITLDPFIYHTTGLCLLPPEDWRLALKQTDPRFIGAALCGLRYLLRQVAPSHCLADVGDLETDVSLFDLGQGDSTSALYLYDRIEGGVGYAEQIYELLEIVLLQCSQLIADCECTNGCPSCIPPSPPGADEELEALMLESNAAVACTASLLTALLDGTIVIPEILRRQVPPNTPIAPPEPDYEAIKLRNRLGRAANILQTKRDREH